MVACMLPTVQTQLERIASEKAAQQLGLERELALARQEAAQVRAPNTYPADCYFEFCAVGASGLGSWPWQGRRRCRLENARPAFPWLSACEGLLGLESWPWHRAPGIVPSPGCVSGDSGSMYLAGRHLSEYVFGRAAFELGA